EEHASYRVVLPGYFHTMGIPLLRGRDVAPGDVVGAEPVVVVNQRLAETHWPGQDPIGKRVGVPDLAGATTYLRIVGVVVDVRQPRWSRSPRSEVYLPYLQTAHYLESPSGHFAYLTVVARTGGDPAALAASLRGLVRELDESATVSQVATMTDVIALAT